MEEGTAALQSSAQTSRSSVSREERELNRDIGGKLFMAFLGNTINQH